MCNLPGFVSRKKDFWSSIQNWSTENFEMMFLFGYLMKNIALDFQDLWLWCLASQKSHVNPAIQVHPIPKTMFFRVTYSFLDKKVE